MRSNSPLTKGLCTYSVNLVSGKRDSEPDEVSTLPLTKELCTYEVNLAFDKWALNHTRGSTSTRSNSSLEKEALNHNEVNLAFDKGAPHLLGQPRLWQKGSALTRSTLSLEKGVLNHNEVNLAFDKGALHLLG
ncbi:unnamed protein product [Vicia faba]|uniref:Uncharacterized protein n=1 Tax=Vicia faba TaxID=3906 RepID=A0AAV0YRC7_VICFA|nr:unnamed protein product [Vicia faba]